MSRRNRPGLSRERVLHAGLKLVDEEGVAALTMRRLGKELGVEAMSLYTYVSSKQDLLDGVLECVYLEMPKVVSVDGPWQERLRAAACSFREVLLCHPNTVCLLATRPVRNEGSLNLLETSLAELRSIGLSLEQADKVLSLLVGFTVGHVAAEVGDAQEQPVALDDYAPVDRDRFPNVAAKVDLGNPDREAE
jgi:TetR/AcrR family transcriptional regulator, tetracycline repressor protein